MSSEQAIKKRRKLGRKDETTAPTPTESSGRRKVKKRRKIENVDGTTTPASNPKDKKGTFSVTFVLLSLLVVMCLVAVFWLLLK